MSYREYTLYTTAPESYDYGRHLAVLDTHWHRHNVGGHPEPLRVLVFDNATDLEVQQARNGSGLYVATECLNDALSFCERIDR